MLPLYQYIIFRTVGPLPLRLATFTDTQARIHTGFQRFPEIGQMFHNKNMFNNNKTFQVESETKEREL